MRSVICPSCICFICASCVHPVAFSNDAFGITCSLLMLVEDTSGDHMEAAYSRGGIMTALEEARGVSFCLHHTVAANYFIICRGLCACSEM